MIERKIWKVSVSRVVILGRVFEFTDSAWIELPAGQNFTLLAGKDVHLDGGRTVARISDKISAILEAPMSFTFTAKDGNTPYVLELPKDTTLEVPHQEIPLRADGYVTTLRQGTRIIWPAVRTPESPLRPEHEVLNNHRDCVFWLPPSGGLTLDGDAGLKALPSWG